jgi:DNA-directed RNA polymerase sigma subunit (sigma70/sigma32)
MGKPRIPCGQGLGLDGVCDDDDLCVYCCTIVDMQGIIRKQEAQITNLKRRLAEETASLDRAREVMRGERGLTLREMAAISMRLERYPPSRGAMTYREVGAMLQVNAVRASQIVHKGWRKMREAVHGVERAAPTGKP